MEDEAKKLLKLNDLNNYVTKLRAQVKQKANELKDLRKHLKEQEYDMSALADPSLDLKCEIA